MEIHSQVFWVRLVSGSLLLAFAGLIFIANWRVFYDNFILRQASSSWTPLLGGFLGAIGLLAIPFSALHQYWWLPFLLDWGSSPGIAHTIWWHLFVGKKPDTATHRGRYD